MRPTFITLLFTPFLLDTIQAQVVRHSLDLSLGALSTNNIVVDVGNPELEFDDIYQDWYYGHPKQKFLINAKYLYGASRRILLGGSFSFEQFSVDLHLDNFRTEKATVRCYTLGFEFLLNYIIEPKFQFYTTAAPAIVFRNDTYSGDLPGIRNGNHKYFNFHVSALGFRFGRNWGGFFEIGLGYKGLIHGGISYQFRSDEHVRADTNDRLRQTKPDTR